MDVRKILDRWRREQQRYGITAQGADGVRLVLLDLDARLGALQTLVERVARGVARGSE